MMKPIEPISDFTWGVAFMDHAVGPYIIREFHPWKRRGRSILTGDADASVINFHGYIDGLNSGESWETLDDALAGLIVKRNLGPNARDINYHFMAGIRALQSK